MEHPKKYEFFYVIIQRRICGAGRILWLKNLRQWYSFLSSELFKAVVNKVIIANMIAPTR